MDADISADHSRKLGQLVAFEYLSIKNSSSLVSLSYFAYIYSLLYLSSQYLSSNSPLSILLNMGLTEIRNICEVSLDIPAEKQEKLHNRWHPDIPFAGTIKNGETVKIECVSRPRCDTVPEVEHPTYNAL